MIIEKKADIIAHLNRVSHQIVEYAKNTEPKLLVETKEGKWSAAQNIEHLTKSAKPLILALRLPRMVLGVFGKKKVFLTYEEVVEKYQEALSKGGKSPATYVPNKIGINKLDSIINDFSETNKQLVELLSFFDETDLNRFCLPHPLIGKLTLKEILFFTIYHMEHHFKTIKTTTK
jgi:hypothetical protein